MTTTKQKGEKMSNYVLECVACSQEKSIAANSSDVEAWRNGKLIQNALPYLDADQREMFISGVCGECWEKMFKES
tara:strand:- start:1577 stop:1801 length:225 start_codon:yes stop_codon:yes gene_type:complete